MDHHDDRGLAEALLFLLPLGAAIWALAAVGAAHLLGWLR